MNRGETDLGGEKHTLSLENSFIWNISGYCADMMHPGILNALTVAVVRISTGYRHSTRRYQGLNPKMLLLEKETLIAEIGRLEKLIEEDQRRFSSFSNSFIPLKIALPVDREIRDIVL